MRVVYWKPQERVDVPDITASNFLVLGEFRRTMRETLLGGEENRIITGFEVEPSAVPDAIVTVKLNDAGTLSAAIGAENVGSHINYGQLMGGEDDNANDEGNAQQTLDFSAQPAATYTVQMRFVYTEGAADDRAHWNPTTDSEYIDNINTRHLPGFELRLSGAPSGEWIDLASVVWDTVSIDAADITDLRVFAMEGVTPYQQTTQDGTGGVPDFSRLTTRGLTTVGVNALWPVVRALGRQVQDMKGPNGTGNWNWWSRAPHPTDPFASLPAAQTKNMQSMDVVTFTVGDGSSTWGDFSGATALEDCLQHIEDMGAFAPASIEIVCRSRATAVPTRYTWPVTTAHAMNAQLEHLTIDFQGNRMTTAHPAASSAISMGAGAELHIKNLTMNTIPTNNGTVFEADVLRIHDSTVYGDAGASAEPAVLCGPASVIRDSNVFGGVQITSGGASAGTDDFYNQAVSVQNAFAYWLLVDDRPAGEKTTPVRIRGSRFRGQHATGYGQTAVVNFGNNSHWVLDSSIINWVATVHGVSCAAANSENPEGGQISGASFVHSDVATAFTSKMAIYASTSVRLSIDKCDFDLDDVLGGGVHLRNTAITRIRDSAFRGGGTAARAATDSAIVFEATGGSTNNDTIISGCQFEDWDPNTTSARTITFTGTIGIVGLDITGCHFQDCGGYCVNLVSSATVNRVTLRGNIVDVDVVTGSGFNLENANNVVVNDNILTFNTASSAAIRGNGVAGGMCSGNRIQNGLITAVAGVMWGFLGGGGPTNLNYVN